MIVKHKLIGKLTFDDYDYNNLINKPAISGVELKGDIDIEKLINDIQLGKLPENIDLSAYALKTDLDLKQDKLDLNLTTKDKTVVGAINDLSNSSYDHNHEYVSIDETAELFGEKSPEQPPIVNPDDPFDEYDYVTFEDVDTLF